MEQPKLSESNRLCLLRTESQGDSENGKTKKKENAYTKFLKLNSLLEKVVELEQTDFPHCLATLC